MLGNIAPYTEPIAVPDTFVSGLGMVEEIGGGCYRFFFYSTQRSIYGDGMERVIVSKLVAPACAVPPAIFTAAKGVGLQLFGMQPRRYLHH